MANGLIELQQSGDAILLLALRRDLRLLLRLFDLLLLIIVISVLLCFGTQWMDVFRSRRSVLIPGRWMDHGCTE